jgi:hypothetical protein
MPNVIVPAPEKVAKNDSAVTLAAAEAELAGLKALLAEVKANLEMRWDRDEWRGRVERLLTNQQRPWRRRLVG